MLAVRIHAHQHSEIENCNTRVHEELQLREKERKRGREGRREGGAKSILVQSLFFFHILRECKISEETINQNPDRKILE